MIGNTQPFQSHILARVSGDKAKCFDDFLSKEGAVVSSVLLAPALVQMQLKRFSQTAFARGRPRKFGGDRKACLV